MNIIIRFLLDKSKKNVILASAQNPNDDTGKKLMQNLAAHRQTLINEIKDLSEDVFPDL